MRDGQSDREVGDEAQASPLWLKGVQGGGSRVDNGLEIPRLEAGGPVRTLVQEGGNGGQDRSGSCDHEDRWAPDNIPEGEPWDSLIGGMRRVRERRSKNYA